MATKRPRRPPPIPANQEPPEGENLLNPGGGGGGIPRAGIFTKAVKTEPPSPPDPKRSRTPESHAKKQETYEKQTTKFHAAQEQKETSRGRRKEWEKSAVGKARTQDASDVYGMPVGQVYHLKGWTEQTGIGPKPWDRQLPGMSDPHAAPRPPRFEELSEETQTHVHEGLARHGTSIKQMTHDYGAQVDQAYERAERHREPRREADRQDAIERGETPPDSGIYPYAMDFYSKGEPRKVIDTSAQDLKIPQPIHAVMNALTSPSTFFSQTSTSTGEVTYPNNETAVHAVNHAQMGKSWKDITNRKTSDPEGPRHQGYEINLKKAAKVMEQHIAGVHPSDWRGIPSKSEPEGPTVWGPKTGPYANSWSDTHPQFFVPDVHSGGGGMLPHLGSDKPILRDEAGQPRMQPSGAPKRDKSEREKAIESIPFFHSAADYAARMAMEQRNLPSIRDTQAGQWGEEKLQRKEAGAKHGVAEEQAYSRSATFHSSRDPAHKYQEETFQSLARGVHGPRRTPTKAEPVYEQDRLL